MVQALGIFRIYRAGIFREKHMSRLHSLTSGGNRWTGRVDIESFTLPAMAEDSKLMSFTQMSPDKS